MNSDLEHKELTMLLSRRAQVKAENERRQIMEQKSAPMLYTILIVVVLLLAGVGSYLAWK